MTYYSIKLQWQLQNFYRKTKKWKTAVHIWIIKKTYSLRFWNIYFSHHYFLFIKLGIGVIIYYSIFVLWINLRKLASKPAIYVVVYKINKQIYFEFIKFVSYTYYCFYIYCSFSFIVLLYLYWMFSISFINNTCVLYYSWTMYLFTWLFWYSIKKAHNVV